MPTNNSIHLIRAAQQRHEHTRAKAIAAMHELDRNAAALTFESVARHAGVSRSWIYTQTDLRDEICRLRAQRRPEPNTALPARQRASDDSLRRRLEIANRRNHELVDENQRLRRQLACALGQLRDDAGRHHEPTHRDSVTIGPC
jgi:AraC-like DNA-binding protein